MSRRVQYSRNQGRYRVYDDTITTWKIVDTQTGEVLQSGLEHYEAHLRASKFNAEGAPQNDGEDGG